MDANMISSDQELPSTRPYLIRALHEWCVDHGFSPYIAVQVDGSVRVPMEFVKNGEIVLNVSPDATSALRLGDEYVEFKARFGGVAREIVVPVTHVIAIYARENGQGMAFPAPAAVAGSSDETGNTPTSRGGALRAVPQGSETNTMMDEDGETPPDAPPPNGKRPQLKRVK
jgi:stringent starvation protein B